MDEDKTLAAFLKVMRNHAEYSVQIHGKGSTEYNMVLSVAQGMADELYADAPKNRLKFLRKIFK